MKIEVNNGGILSFEHWDNGDVVIESINEKGNIDRIDVFREDEIVMVANLLRYMKDCGCKSAYLVSEEYGATLEKILKPGLIEEFRLFQ